MKKILILLFVLLPAGLLGQEAKESHSFKVMKHLDIFNKAYTELDQYYVDSLDAEKRILEALRYVLFRVDPFTTLYTKEEAHSLRESSTGQYAGIGSPIVFRDDLKRCMFSDPYPDMPAGRAGVRTGDIVWRIDSLDMAMAKGESQQDFLSRVTNCLRGEAGTAFQLCVKRPWVEDSMLTFTLKRELIERPTVVHTHITPDSIGYIKLESYMLSTTREVKQAILELKQKGMKKLVLDLRGNGGGLMDQAVGVVGLFMPRGTKVVETKGKVGWSNESSLTEDLPVDLKMPLVVMVDEATASSAEITAGALQDYDRAVIVGQRTYGKGLVQTSRELPYQALLKLTVSKYFIPSGRCVQAYKYENGEPVYQPDSVAQTFYTRNGRPVKDGGGIMPDVVLKDSVMPEFMYALTYDYRFVDFVVKYRNTHPAIARAATFEFTDADFEAFKCFMVERGFTFKPQVQDVFELLEKLAEKQGVKHLKDNTSYQSLRGLLMPALNTLFEANEASIKTALSREILKNAYSEQEMLDYDIVRDDKFKRACELLSDEEGYKAILKGK